MSSLSANRIKLLVIVLLALSSSILEASDWPVKRNIDLSSGFGDFRMNRFHTGVDIRTGGKIGESIFSPVNGSIYRIRTAYSGYGKGLYILGDDGYIYVYGHLNDFNGNIDNLIKSSQIASKRYYQDITLPKDSMKVKKGEFLGYTGQTGAGAPHLHFEKRTSKNIPVNPLKNGFTLSDKIAPVFTDLGFKMMDDHSLFDNGYRELSYKVVRDSKTGNYTLDTVLYFKKPFAVFTGVYDKMRKGGMNQTVYKLSLLVDDTLMYQIQFDSLDFKSQRSVNFEYEYLRAVNKQKNIRRLYDVTGNEYWGSISTSNHDGIIQFISRNSIGFHNAKIIAEDSFGNKSELAFDFIWGPEEYLYHFDSLVFIKPKDNFFYFTPVTEISALKIDSVMPYVNKGKHWGIANGTEVETLENGQIRCKLISTSIRKATACLFAYSKNAIIQDNLFNGIQPKGKTNGTISYDILDDGLLVKLEIPGLFSAASRTEIYYKDSLLGVEKPMLLNMNTYHCFIKAQPKYAQIDRIAFRMSDDTLLQSILSDSLHIVLVGYENDQILEYNKFKFTFHKRNFYTPRFIEIKRRLYPKNYGERLASSVYEILPKAFVCKEGFDVSLELPEDNSFNNRTGICWLNKEKEKWVWLDVQTDSEQLSLSTTSSGGGVFAGVYDLLEPEVKLLSIKDGRTYNNLQPRINFLLEDNLSGIADDQSILVRLDNNWMIPEYDPESKRFKTKPLEALSDGKHHLGIEITDKAGNVYEQYLNFYVKKK